MIKMSELAFIQWILLFLLNVRGQNLPKDWKLLPCQLLDQTQGSIVFHSVVSTKVLSHLHWCIVVMLHGVIGCHI